VSVDVYEDHIRFLGYHVPVDMSKLPPTAADALVHELQAGADCSKGADQEEIDDAVNAERGRVLDLVETLLSRIEDAVDEESLKQVRAEVEKLRAFVDDAA
jgi:hypothetical protein